LVFVVITVLVFAIGGSTPDHHDSALKVAAYYHKHHDKQMILAFILAVGVPFLVFFASALRHDLARAGGTGQAANIAFAGGVLAAAGFTILATIHLALADAGDSVNTLGTTQTLNVLDNNDYLPVGTGVAVLVFGGGLAAIRHGGLPAWLGWAGIVLAVLTFTPAGFFAFLLGGVWIAVASILLTLSRQSAVPTSPPPAPAV
jgi:hypothetical protein